MAAINSIGLLEPSALQYLISELILPPDPPSSLYVWSYQESAHNNVRVVDEVLQTAACVVWSCNGIIKRVFNLDVEGEIVTHAFTTSFEHRGRQKYGVLDESSSIPDAKEKALVVLLKSQAHIFLLSGDMLVVPLNFEIKSAIPSALGFLLQRKLPSDQVHVAPHLTVGNAVSRSSIDIGEVRASYAASKPLSIHHQAKIPATTSIRSRTFAFPELLGELNLVVSGSARKQDPLESLPVLSPEEEIIYASTYDELHELQMQSVAPVYLSITVNENAKTLTIWQIAYKHDRQSNSTHGSQIRKSGINSKRKGSNVYGRQTGATPSSIRAPGPFRESLAGPTQSFSGSGVFAFPKDEQVSSPGDLAARLGHEFEQIGVQTRSARRISSMLARTDLGAAHDRSAFTEMSSGTIGRKSFGRSMIRGESLGGFSDRQSFGTKRRSSFQATSSVYSDGTSFLDLHASQLLDNATVGNGLDTLNDLHDTGVSNKMPREVAFLKLKSLPYEFVDSDLDKRATFRVSTMLAPDRSTADDRRSRVISVCVMDKHKKEMTIVNIAAKLPLLSGKQTPNRANFDLKAVEVQRGQSIMDACTVIEEGTKRLLILTQTRDGKSVLHLEAPWSASFRINLPTRFKVFNSMTASPSNSPESRRDTGIHRVIPQKEVKFTFLQNFNFQNQIMALDSNGRWHLLQIRLLPSQSLPRQILQMCNLVLAPEFCDSVLVAWWEVKRWIESQGSELEIEWTALVVALFVLAVPFISVLQNRSAQGPKRKKGAQPRSSSGTSIDLGQWDKMLDVDKERSYQAHASVASWTWLITDDTERVEVRTPGKTLRNLPSTTRHEAKSDPFLINCVNMARDFLQSPAGESAIGPEGYLAIAVNKDRSVRRTALASIEVGLHLLREELKLYDLAASTSFEIYNRLTAVIAQIGSWLQWQDWCMESGKYYVSEADDPARWAFESSSIDTLEIPTQPFVPPSIFGYVHASITGQDISSFPSLLDLVSQTRTVTPNHPLWAAALRITPRLFAITSFLKHLPRTRGPRSIIKAMMICGLDRRFLSTMPTGLAIVCQQAIIGIKERSNSSWSKETKLLLGSNIDIDDKLADIKIGPSLAIQNHEAFRDHRAISNVALETDSASRWDALSEIHRQTITKLMFSEDRRFQEASKLVNQTRAPLVECTAEPGWSEADLLEAQKELSVYVTRRTLSVAAGRAMMHFDTKVTLLTERVPVPAFSLQCVMISGRDNSNSQPMTLSADKALFTEDKVCWAFFHNGASAGLMISKDTHWIDTSWILYNKPPELTNRHAGFLLALGLNGHLKSLAKWVAFKYLTPKHTMTSVGLLLGLAASYLGTMDTLIARLLSVHVTRLLPVGAAELNLSPLTQTAGIMGVGLLYYRSQHRRMSEIMLSEIENNDIEDRSGDEPILRDEGYRLAAGFSLGLINLGCGQDLRSLHDMNVTERLLAIAIGTKNVNLVHVLDRATAGAVIALAFIFMKTNNKTVAQKIDIPDTLHQFDYVRPDIFLLRTLARHLVMWDSIAATKEFIKISLPPPFRQRVDLSTTKRLSTDDLPFFNVMAGMCFAMSLRFAGSHRADARDLLVCYLDQFLRLSRLPALNYDAKVTLNGVRNCLDVLALSCATVMAGSGDVTVMRRLRALHGRTDKDTPFGSHLAAHMALGVLFLSGGTATFGTGNLAVAALVISLYPLFPVDVLDNNGHLQAFRHLWVLATENRCLSAKDSVTQQIIGNITAYVELTNGTILELNTPCLLPEFDLIRKISFRHHSYWPVQIDLEAYPSSPSTSKETQAFRRTAEKNIRERIRANGKGIQIPLQRRVEYEKPDTDTFFAELQSLDAARGVPSTDKDASVNEKWRNAHRVGTNTEARRYKPPFEWVFGLATLQFLDFREKSLVLDSADCKAESGRAFLQDTAIDAILDLEYGCLGLEHYNDDYDFDDDYDADEHANNDGDNNDNRNDKGIKAAAAAAEATNVQARKKILPGRPVEKDKLWQLRLLLDWTDRWDAEAMSSSTSATTTTAEARGLRNDTTKNANAEANGSDVRHGQGHQQREAVRWMKEDFVEHLRMRIWRMASQE